MQIRSDRKRDLKRRLNERNKVLFIIKLDKFFSKSKRFHKKPSQSMNLCCQSRQPTLAGISLSHVPLHPPPPNTLVYALPRTCAPYTRILFPSRPTFLPAVKENYHTRQPPLSPTAIKLYRAVLSLCASLPHAHIPRCP